MGNGLFGVEAMGFSECNVNNLFSPRESSDTPEGPEEGSAEGLPCPDGRFSGFDRVEGFGTGSSFTHDEPSLGVWQPQWQHACA